VQHKRDAFSLTF